MKRAGLDFGIKKTTANAVASVYIFTYNYNNNKSVYKLENQTKLVIQRNEKTKGLHNPEISIIETDNNFINSQSFLILKYTDIDKL